MLVVSNEKNIAFERRIPNRNEHDKIPPLLNFKIENIDMSHFDTEIDTSGLNCPLPLLKAKKALSTMQVGERLRVIATDRAAFIDIPVYCEISVHRLVDSSETVDELIFIIEKGEV